MKSVAPHPEAKAELDDAVAYYESQRRGLGLKFLAEFKKAIRLVRRHPGIGTRYQQTSVRRVLLRRFPYSIYYEELNDRIWVAAVAHQKRKLGYWLNRRSKG